MSFAHFGLLLLLIICETIIFLLDNHSRKLVFLSTILLFVPFYIVLISFESYSIQRYLVFDNFSLSMLSYLVFIISILGFVIATVLMNSVRIKEIEEKKAYSTKLINFSFYLTAFISLIAFLINFNRVGGVGGVSILLTEPRLYELTFGANTITNYLYFLNIPALIFLIKKIELKNANFVDWLLGIILVLISFFHGIKFTIFDTILMPFIFYVFNSGKLNFKKMVSGYLLIFTSLLVIYFIFSYNVRGASSGLLLTLTSYVYPNVINTLYSIEVQPLAFNFIRSIWIHEIPYIFEFLTVTGPKGFVLNDGYNLRTGILTMYESINFLGLIVFPIIFLYMSKYLLKKRKRNIFTLFFATYWHYCLIFLFFGWPFMRMKFIYYLVFFFAWEILYNNISQKDKRLKDI